MGERLAAPPLIEAVCQFSFINDGTWNWTIPGLLYEKIGSEFPVRSQQLNVPQTLLFKKSDDSAIVITGPYLLSINHLKPYTGWDTYFPMIKSVYETYLDLFQSSRVTRIRLKYINEIPLNEMTNNNLKLENWLTFAPKFLGSLEMPLQMFYQKYEFQSNTPQGTLVHQTGVRIVEQRKSLIIDLDFISNEFSSTSPIDKSQIYEWIAQSHNLIFETFKDSITPNLFKQLKDGKTS